MGGKNMHAAEPRARVSSLDGLLYDIAGYLPSHPLAFLAAAPATRHAVERVVCDPLLRSAATQWGGTSHPEGEVWLPHTGALCGQLTNLKYTLWWIRRQAGVNGGKLAALFFAYRCSIGDLTEVKNFCGLRCLFIPEATLLNKTLSPLAACATLEHLWLRSCRSVTRVGALGHLRSLKSLDLSKTGVTDDALLALAACPLLEKVDLSGCAFICAIPFMQGMTRLRVLKLRNSGITDRAIAVVGTAIALTHLDLAGCFLVTSLNPLGLLSRLEWLNASWCGVRDGGLEGLSRCENLEYLSLSRCWDFCGVNALCGLPKLQVLDLRGTNVDGEGVAGLARCLSLSILNLSGCFCIHSVSVFAAMPSLKEIDVSYTAVTEESLRRLPSWVRVVRKPVRVPSCSASLAHLETPRHPRVR
ncbi:putative leucine-rich repeat protein (LRRP) [Trypanosoma conorhini]|uniref:Putative leucine-rich repeat protein (LRRP) n=1 Tax=Trypanosoma conorhini TaxID=83891 RepID=A0A422QAM4_9TRYP|nr:putative leucine-rich repeat protein (LRRP) [Trypanosoma conorhini]RNF26955.1 putative leucine-rich repeat protein (LRRP) [Trypanosoma conorhini]